MQLLRSMGVAVRSEASSVEDVTVAKLRARFERERRAGHGEAEEAIGTVIEDAAPVKRRRRKKEDLPPAPEPEFEPEPVAEVAPEPEKLPDSFTAPIAETKPTLEELFPTRPPAPEPVAENAAEQVAETSEP